MNEQEFWRLVAEYLLAQTQGQQEYPMYEDTTAIGNDMAMTSGGANANPTGGQENNAWGPNVLTMDPRSHFQSGSLAYPPFDTYGNFTPQELGVTEPQYLSEAAMQEVGLRTLDTPAPAVTQATSALSGAMQHRGQNPIAVYLDTIAAGTGLGANIGAGPNQTPRAPIMQPQALSPWQTSTSDAQMQDHFNRTVFGQPTTVSSSTPAPASAGAVLPANAYPYTSGRQNTGMGEAARRQQANAVPAAQPKSRQTAQQVVRTLSQPAARNTAASSPPPAPRQNPPAQRNTTPSPAFSGNVARNVSRSRSR